MEKELMLRIGEDGKLTKYEEPYATIECPTEEDFNSLIKMNKQIKEAETPVDISEWHEDYGDCLWWNFPIEEAPYVGSPLSDDFPDYVTHFTKIIEPKELNI